MTNDDTFEKLFAIAAVGYLGYAKGKEKYQGWDSFIEKLNQRFGILSYNKIVLPFRFFLKSNNSKILYAEAINSYLSGFPNASAPLTIRVFELALRQKYEEVEGKTSKEKNLKELIDWAERYLGDKKDVAQGFRLLRNIVHEDGIISEPKALDAIRYTSDFINLIYPFSHVWIKTKCNYCGFTGNMLANGEESHIGDNKKIQCNCGKISDQLISHISEAVEKPISLTDI